MKEDSVFWRERRVWAAEIPVRLLKEFEKEESVKRRSRDENCVSELEVRAECLDSGSWISGGCGCKYISSYSMIKI